MENFMLLCSVLNILRHIVLTIAHVRSTGHRSSSQASSLRVKSKNKTKEGSFKIR